ncbi:RagB/SusD family nutrient uptake outer membrane protein [Ekhidna sp.]|uniref:RagB/SusD family nutrient uptake outer membrane protein n=1 Tax=Ekhidna sp. TaxID=2608089 RepID=UPI003B59BEAA
MKKFKIILIGIAVFTFSCEDRLEIEPEQSISLESAVSSEQNLLATLVGAYQEAGDGASYGGNFQIMADLLGSDGSLNWGGTFLGYRQIRNKQVLVDNNDVDRGWVNTYQYINLVNLVIDNVSIIEDQAVAETAEGEAKFLRALGYFDLIRFFGQKYNPGGGNTQLGVPLRITGITDFGQDLTADRASVEAVYTQILNDLNDAYTLLPESNGFFADRYAAQALRARVYLQQGDYTNARDAANDVLQNSGHDIVGSYAAAFNNDADSNEDIFAFQVTSQTGENELITFYASQANGGRGGDITPTAAYFALFDDPTDDRANFTVGGLTAKYTNQFANVPLIRAAEMYLIRAECNQRLGTTVGDTPLNDINALRNRANANTFGAVTLNDILNERKLELGMEGVFYHDVKRLEGSSDGFAWDDDEMLMPIPQRETNTNPVDQNPGYTS